jgi:hypothetical protein
VRLHRLDLDGSLPAQGAGGSLPMHDWGPHVRLACSFGRYRRFERTLNERLGPHTEPELTFYGSGDFHHVSLGLVRRAAVECNLLVLDLHPDWMRAVPLMHCGTWVWHALRLPHVRRVFHVGGDMDFDNAYRWLAPWPDLRSGRLTVWPARRRFERGRWPEVEQRPLDGNRLVELLKPHAAELARRPLYVSLDKDVMVRADAVVNWESGFLNWAEVRDVLTTFVEAAGGRLAGLDVTGDWSPVEVRGLMRRWLDRSEHPALVIDAREAATTNARTNAAIIDLMLRDASARRR